MPEENGSKPRGSINPPVFYGAAALILLFAIFGVAAPDIAEQAFSAVSGWVIETFGWFYLLAVAVFLIFCLVLALSGFGRIKLGPEQAEPDFSYLSWFAMLFSAGMGIGLLFFGVAEPIMHFTSPPVGEGGTVQAARQAMAITFFHWGLHAWAIYAVVGLALAYFGFRHNLPLTIRSALYPLIGERIYGPIGHAVDIFAVLGTMFGVATSLGLGVMQINSGINYLFGAPESTLVQIALIAGITLLATISVVAGLERGIRRLSEVNLWLALALLLLVMLLGPTLYLLQTLVQNTGNYLNSLVSNTFNLFAYNPAGEEWVGGWTLFYWAWWISWSPFVGMFIARVSRGRTIREFVFGVLFVPVGFTFLWMTFFGNTAINIELSEAGGVIASAVSESTPTAIFALFEQLPLSMILSGLATLLVVTFFVTSSDSGSLVIDIITSGGSQDPPVWQRVFWAVTEGVVAAVLLIAGGLSALQTAVIASALPFTVIMLFMCWGLYRGLRLESLKKHAYAVAPTMAGGERVSWQKRLKATTSHYKKDNVVEFVNTTASEALENVAAELRTQGHRAEVERDENRVTMTVYYEDSPDFIYAVHVRGYQIADFAFPEFQTRSDDRRKHYRAEVYLAEGSQHYDIMGYTREQVIGDVISQYEKHLHFLHLAR